jgi:hypothetical protein
VTAFASNDAADSMQTMSYLHDGEIVANFNAAVTDLNGRGAFDGFDADGWRLNYAEVPGTSTERFVYLAMKMGGNVKVVPVSAGANNTPFKLTTGFQAKALLAFYTQDDNAGFCAAGTPINHARVAIGAGTGPAERGTVGMWDQHNQATSAVTSTLEFDQLIMMPQVGGGVPDEIFDIVSMDTDGVTLVQDEAASGGYGARSFGLIVFGEPGPVTQAKRSLQQYRQRR